MCTRWHWRSDDSGFTLIELLVVVSSSASSPRSPKDLLGHRVKAADSRRRRRPQCCLAGRVVPCVGSTSEADCWLATPTWEDHHPRRPVQRHRPRGPHVRATQVETATRSAVTKAGRLVSAAVLHVDGRRPAAATARTGERPPICPFLQSRSGPVKPTDDHCAPPSEVRGQTAREWGAQSHGSSDRLNDSRTATKVLDFRGKGRTSLSTAP